MAFLKKLLTPYRITEAYGLSVAERQKRATCKCVDKDVCPKCQAIRDTTGFPIFQLEVPLLSCVECVAPPLTSNNPKVISTENQYRDWFSSFKSDEDIAKYATCLLKHNPRLLTHLISQAKGFDCEYPHGREPLNEYWAHVAENTIAPPIPPPK